MTVTFVENTGATDVATATGVASASDQTTITVGATAVKFQAGDTVTLATFTSNNGDYVVASVTATTIVIFNNGTAPTGTGTVTYKSQAPINVGADLTADGVAENLTYAVNPSEAEVIGAAKVYTKCEFHFYDVKGVGGFNQASGNQRFVLEMYIDQSITAASYKAVVDAIDVVIAALPA